jgi:putative ABC transport system permease protein
LLQFGILRAIGLSRPGLIATLIWEQMLVSGSAIVAGVGAGVLTGYLFVPTLQHMYSASEQVPPFVVTIQQSDLTMLFLTLGGMLAIGLTVLFVIVRKLKVDQVIKLGED